MIDKIEAGQIVARARFRSGKTWQELADAIGKPPVWTTAALLGQHPMTSDDAWKIGELLELDDDVVEALQVQPYRGSGVQQIPTDPTMYRLYEALDVYGAALKELIHEEFGDGIMSAINFKVDVERRADPAGDRVVVTFDGKFLDYNW
ncbi:cyanase [Rhodococcus sp. HNM0569]|uniref:cyanase n=1 Tax=Rhodococcus sp. HNM0569 TaxID=2716340 RepID=UPI00146EB35E|nr:cyanase [Rhodococcus sp. HNM0569]NLU83403.1 cyanase [Rhodococcus sp. HNM0569]